MRGWRCISSASIATTIPLFGAVSAFGAASVLGVPFVLALLGKDQILVASALALISGLGDLMPPTALAGIFAAQVTGEEDYFAVLRHCVVPGVATALWGIGMIVWGLASVIIGEALVGSNRLGLALAGAVMGSILFRLLVAIALRWGLHPNNLKLITAVFVFAALVLPLAAAKLRKEYAARRAPGAASAG